MALIVIGNIIAFIGSVAMVYSGYLKQKKTILIAQTVQLGLFVVSNFILGGIPGAIINIINCLRNVICYKNKLNLVVKIVLIGIGTTLSIMFNNLGIIGLLPVIASVMYILLMDIKDVVKFKVLIIINVAFWLIYDAYIKSYTSACFDLLTIITSIISIIQINRKAKSSLNEQNK